MKNKLLILLAASQFMVAPAVLAQAESYPSQPVQLIVPYPPGGGTDTVARLLSQELTDILGQPVVVENRPGATGSVGINAVAQAEPDGHTLGLVLATFITNPMLYGNLPYGYDDFEPVTILGQTPYVLTVNPEVPAETAEDFVAYLQENPGALAYASSGIGSGPHLSAELLLQQLDADMVHIPYGGAGPANVDLLSGEVQVMFNNFTAAMSYIEDGSLRLLAVTTPNRSPIAPDTPSLSELVPGTEVTNWYGVVAPAGTPADIVAKAQEALAEAVMRPALKERLEGEGWDLVLSTPEEFGEFLDNEVARWQVVIDGAGIELE